MHEVNAGRTCMHACSLLIKWRPAKRRQHHCGQECCHRRHAHPDSSICVKPLQRSALRRALRPRQVLGRI